MPAPPYPITGAPGYYSRCIGFANRNGVFYQGEAPPALTLSQGTPSGYYVLNHKGEQVTSGTLTPLPIAPLQRPGALAIATTWWGTNPLATPYDAPLWSPSGTTTAATGTSDYTGIVGAPVAGGADPYWKISANTLQVPGTTPPSFTTAFPQDPSFGSGVEWVSNFAFIKAAVGQQAHVVQSVVKTVTTIASSYTINVSATSTSNLLCLDVGYAYTDLHNAFAAGAAPTVTDNAGNTWTRVQQVPNPAIGWPSGALYVTETAHPGSITQITVTFPTVPGVSSPGHFAAVFYEIGGAQNNSPIDTLPQSLRLVNFGDLFNYSLNASLAMVTPSNELTLASPAGGWRCGWYRIYFTGNATDPVFGPSYGATSFVVIRPDSRFLRVTDSSIGYTSNEGAPLDFPMKGSLGLGYSRLGVVAASDPTTAIADITPNVAAAKTYWSQPGAPYEDGARDRPLFVAFPGYSIDNFPIEGVSHPFPPPFLVYCKDGTVDGSKVFIEVVAGSVSGAKLNVYHPDAVTLVESYDNGPTWGTVDAHGFQTANSAYIRTLTFGSGPLILPQGPTAIGNANFNGIKAIIAAFYPDVEYFEGPYNEPRADSALDGARTGHEMELFTAAVHAGNASAKSMGFCPVNIFAKNNGSAAGVQGFYNQGYGAASDAVSFHDYNTMVNGDINMGRAGIENFLALLAANGITSPTIFQTEATQPFTAVSGVYHPRRARVPMIATLLWEQYGLPRERNPLWYDVSHGFWSYAAFLENSDTSLDPCCALFRTLAMETFGMVHAQRLHFGPVGDKIFLGSIYQAPGDGASTVVLVAASYIDDATVTLAVAGTTDPITFSDAYGNLDLAHQSDEHLITVPVSDVPTYVRLPVGVSATVYSCNDWPQVGVNGQGTSGSGLAATAKLGGVPATQLGDGKYAIWYPDAANVAFSANSLPDTAVFTFDRPMPVDRVVIWCTSCWQTLSALTDFDVQTTVDGTTWVTQKTFTKPATSFPFGTDTSQTGCTRETYWDEQWIFDMAFPAPVNCLGVRLYVRDTSCGGEPDDAAVHAGGQGSPFYGAASPLHQVVLQEIAVLCDANTHERVVLVS